MKMDESNSRKWFHSIVRVLAVICAIDLSFNLCKLCNNAYTDDVEPKSGDYIGDVVNGVVCDGGHVRFTCKKWFHPYVATHYENGVKNGKQVCFNTGGRLNTVMEYGNGVLHGRVDRYDSDWRTGPLYSGICSNGIPVNGKFIVDEIVQGEYELDRSPYWDAGKRARFLVAQYSDGKLLNVSDQSSF